MSSVLQVSASPGPSQPRGFLPVVNNGSLSIVLCFACLYLVTSGGGPISLDAMRKKT